MWAPTRRRATSSLSRLSAGCRRSASYGPLITRIVVERGDERVILTMWDMSAPFRRGCVSMLSKVASPSAPMPTGHLARAEVVFRTGESAIGPLHRDGVAEAAGGIGGEALIPMLFRSGVVRRADSDVWFDVDVFSHLRSGRGFDVRARYGSIRQEADLLGHRDVHFSRGVHCNDRGRSPRRSVSTRMLNHTLPRQDLPTQTFSSGPAPRTTLGHRNGIASERSG